MRIDAYLYKNGYSQSRTKAKELIDEGKVSIDGKVCTKASYEVDENACKISVEKSFFDGYVGRGGIKLAFALEKFGICADGKICVDIGASTGGFTEVLLRSGAKKVYAVDSGTGQLAEKLKNDERVFSMENFNARNLDISDIGGKAAEIVVMDVSFISQKLIYPAIKRIAEKNADIVTLIKPQFEAGREEVGKKGVVRDSEVHVRVVEEILDFARTEGLSVLGLDYSPIRGPEGNIEYICHLKNNADLGCTPDVRAVVSASHQDLDS